MSEPLPNGTNGRDAQGRFTVGWRGGPGNPFVRQSAALRQAMLEAVTPEDMRVIIQKLVEKAKTGDMAATKLVLLWTCGKPHEPYAPVAATEGAHVEEPEASEVEDPEDWQQHIPPEGWDATGVDPYKAAEPIARELLDHWIRKKQAGQRQPQG